MPRRSDRPDRDFGIKLEHDKNFRGPRSKRSCTDVICLLIFVAFLAGWGFVGYYAYHHGDINRILVPTDSQGLQCGVDSQVLDKPFLLFFDLQKCIDPAVTITGCPTPQVCVEKCPQSTFYFEKNQCTSDTLPGIKNQLICIRDVIVDNINECNQVQQLIDSNRCARWYLQSESYLNRCVSLLPSTFCLNVPNRWLTNLGLSTARNTAPKDKCTENRELANALLIEKMSSSFSVMQFIDYVCFLLGVLLAVLWELHVSRRCIPFNFTDGNFIPDLGETELMKAVNNVELLANIFGEGQKIVSDIAVAVVPIGVALLLAMVCCLILIAMMRWLAGPLLWLSILGVIGLLGFAVFYSQDRYRYFVANPPFRPNPSTNLDAIINNYGQSKTTWLVILIASSVVLLVLLLVLLVLRKRILIAIALVKEGSKAVSSSYSTVFFPIFPWILQIATIGFAIYVGLMLMSVGEQHYQVVGMTNDPGCRCSGTAASYKDGASCDPRVFQENCENTNNDIFSLRTLLVRETRMTCKTAACFFKSMEQPKEVPYFHIVNVVGFFWLVFFISALGQMVLAAVFATWFWSFKKSSVPFFTLTRALGRTIRYHLGTLAFGSLILTICRLIRVVLAYIQKKLETYDNIVTRAILCCMQCFFWCLEKFLMFLNKNAYIMCAVHGTNFCGSAKDAFELLMRNVLRVFALDQVTSFLFFMAKLLVTLGMGATTYFYLDSNLNGVVQLNYKFVPPIVVMIGTYLISTVFFGVYSMAVDTLFLCFLEDSERNDGSEEKPYFMSKNLMRILGKQNDISRHHYVD